MSTSSLLQSITKDWGHADFELVKKSVSTVPTSKLSTPFCMLEFEMVISQGMLTEQDKLGIGIAVDFEAPCDRGVRVSAVADGMKYSSVKPSFPMSLRSSMYGKSKLKAVPCPLNDRDVLIAIGDSDVSPADNSSTLLKKIMLEKFKLSRTDPANQGSVKCKFGRLFNYQDALEQLEVLASLPIVLVGATPQDLVEITDIGTGRQQASTVSSLMGHSDKSSLRIQSPGSTIDVPRSVGLDRRSRLTGDGQPNESSFAGKSNLDMRSRFAAQTLGKQEIKLTDVSLVHVVSGKIKADPSPASSKNPAFNEDVKKLSPVSQQVIPGESENDESVTPMTANLSNSPEKPTNPFYNPSPKAGRDQAPALLDTPLVEAPKVEPSPDRISDENEKQANQAASVVASITTTSPVETARICEISSFAALSPVFVGAIIVIICIMFLVVSRSSHSSDESPIAPFPEKYVNIYHSIRIFEDASKNFKGVLAPDIVYID